MRDEVNHWLDDRCAQAFWDQCLALPYQELLRDTARWLEPHAGETWLDLGCGSGQLTALLWYKTQGQLARIVCMDCAAVNEQAIARLRRKLTPTPADGQIVFCRHNFSDGLPQFADGTFDGIVSGLALSYAESRDARGQYTDSAYKRLLAEAARVLKPHGQFVFSVNVPEPRFGRIFWRSLPAAWRIRRPMRVLLNALAMLRYGRWLKREARRGRFHFLPASILVQYLRAAGFGDLRVRLSYADQAYVIAARRLAAHDVPAPGCRDDRNRTLSQVREPLGSPVRPAAR